MVTVIDSVMGSGKTTWALNYMMELNKPFIFITPFLTEVQRVKNYGLEHGKDVREPINKGNGKLDNLKDLINNSDNIAATHELFKLFDEEVMDLLLFQDYVLILDEVLDVANKYEGLSVTGDIAYLLRTNTISIVDDVVYWNEEYKNIDSRYNDIRLLCSTHNLIKSSNAILWKFPDNVFTELFSDIVIMTYMFEASILSGYFAKYNISYDKKCIQGGQLVDYVRQDVSCYKPLITIYNRKLKSEKTIKQKPTAMSKSWYDNKLNADEVKELSANLKNYYRTDVKAEKGSRLWTAYKNNVNALTSKGITKDFLSCNSKGTNDYVNTYNLAYMINRYIDPSIINFINSSGQAFDKDKYALGEMLQWIWRSRIRRGEPINLYIPSDRMRSLLIDWLDNKI